MVSSSSSSLLIFDEGAREKVNDERTERHWKAKLAEVCS